jgi:molybdopterin-guanine dinucleotide biosynthesis protein A
MKPEIISYLFDAAGDAQVTVPMWPKGRLETLIMVLERKSAIAITQSLCRLRRPRSDDVVRGAEKALFVSPLRKSKS